MLAGAVPGFWTNPLSVSFGGCGELIVVAVLMALGGGAGPDGFYWEVGGVVVLVVVTG